MEFAFTQEQEMIRDTAASFLKDASTSAAIRSAMASDLGYSPDLWQRICTDMYWQALHIPEEYGGMGLGYVELVAVLEQMGRYLLCSPYLATVAMATNALLIAGTDDQKTEILPQLIEGKTATLAFNGGSNLWSADAVTASYKRDGDTAILNGQYRYVLDGHSADYLIIAAREEGSVGAEGISLFVCTADTDGIQRSLLPTMDQSRRQAAIELTDLRLPAESVMGDFGTAAKALSKILDLATIALAAEQAGGMQQILDITVDYTKSRNQFGRSIAGFQAIKHKAADMMLRNEVARSAVYYAACIADDALSAGPLADELAEAASIAKSYCSEAYFKNAGEALQMHGGVGFTWEYDVHLYFKRAKASEHFLGNSVYHRERVAGVLLD
ncbi:acyl-CoA dehydrogenase family protein [Zhongshania aquimaris]|uniref:Acyl-CoA/acyl-ACP dehydrogenase n=1 Tax=Zhongshania aquimaris TaxID=2857107 RepID=A0ABS6VP92_9GAMM|nr:acyl-CoA dehydrogenase family protein [Zhongshania aquimaris]MBW2940134.1 acyl-CoA/acyl-ACP dehydrogenase [Zhongshania aquimaris]